MQSLIWTTANGKKLRLDQISHDHLSNIYHYSRLFQHRQPELHPILKNLLNERFNGEVLPYDPKYYFEVEELKSLGYLQVKNGICVVMFEGKKIGVVRKELLKDTLCLQN